MPSASNPSREPSSRSRGRSSGRETPVGQPLVGQAEEFILPEGGGEQATELFREFARSHHHAHATDDTFVEEGSEEEVLGKAQKPLPWWKRPSPWWYVAPPVLHI